MVLENQILELDGFPIGQFGITEVQEVAVLVGGENKIYMKIVQTGNCETTVSYVLNFLVS